MALEEAVTKRWTSGIGSGPMKGLCRDIFKIVDRRHTGTQMGELDCCVTSTTIIIKVSASFLRCIHSFHATRSYINGTTTKHPCLTCLLTFPCPLWQHVIWWWALSSPLDCMMVLHTIQEGRGKESSCSTSVCIKGCGWEWGYRAHMQILVSSGKKRGFLWGRVGEKRVEGM